MRMQVVSTSCTKSGVGGATGVLTAQSAVPLWSSTPHNPSKATFPTPGRGGREHLEKPISRRNACYGMEIEFLKIAAAPCTMCSASTQQSAVIVDR